ncbi:MAG TPA: NapC/NirT family cytochrome c [Sumerlaeia bacterium]|nr:NapC/NirT family cytochrome c [Sumerlaeia bacterium]
MLGGILRRSRSGKGKEPEKRRGRAFFAGFLSAVAVAATGFFLVDKAMGPLSEPQFCARCHEMKEVHESWIQSPHHTNPSGVRVACVSCHLPPREDCVSHLTAKAWAGAKNVSVRAFREYDGEAARRRALRTLPSEWCVRCHNNLTGRPSSSAVGIVHAASLEQPRSRQYACVACHDALHGPRAEPAAGKECERADNSFCYVCHVNFQTEEFTDVHMAAGVGCKTCHGKCAEHADDEDHVTPPDVMYRKAQVDASCMTAECHPRERMEEEIGHRPFFAGAEPERQYCTDCHGAHRLATRQRRWDRESRKLIERDGNPVGADGD